MIHMQIWHDSLIQKPLSRSIVHIWRVPACPAPVALDYWRAVLTAREHERLRRYNQEAARRKSVGWGARRILLGRYLRCDPRAVPLQTSPTGQPVIEGETDGLNFSVTYSAAWTVVAVARERRLGVDAEWVRNVDVAELAPICLSPNERAEWSVNAPTAEQELQRFFPMWTCKEAYLKARGTGLEKELHSVAIRFSAEGTIDRIESADDPLAAARWSIRQLTIDRTTLVTLVAERLGADFGLWFGSLTPD